MSTLYCKTQQVQEPNASYISQEKKARIQYLLSQMFNAVTPQNQMTSPVYAWFPEGEQTQEDLPVIDFQIPSCSTPLSTIKGSICTLLGADAAESIVRIAPRLATAGDAIAIKDEFTGESVVGLIAVDARGNLVVDSVDARGWSRHPLGYYRETRTILAAYRVVQ